MRQNKERVHGLLPFLSVLFMIGAVVTLASAGWLPVSLSPSSPMENTEKSRLLSHLSTVDRVGYEPDSMVLFSGNTPVMIVWTAADPMELWSSTGQFVAPLSFDEHRQVVAVTSETIGNCQGKEPSPHDLMRAPTHAIA